MVEERLGYLIKRAQQSMRSLMDQELQEARLTTPQYAALSVLEAHQGLSNAELARRCFLTPQTMHKIVTGLEEKGLVRREPDPDHGRKINTLLTENGHEVLAKGHQIVKDIERKMTSELSDEQIKKTKQHLKTCIHSLNQYQKK